MRFAKLPGRLAARFGAVAHRQQLATSIAFPKRKNPAVARRVFRISLEAD